MHMSFYDDPQNTTEQKRTEQGWTGKLHLYANKEMCFFLFILVNMSFKASSQINL